MARKGLERKGVSQDNDGLRHAPVKEPLGYEFCTISQKSVSLRALHGGFLLTLNGVQDLQAHLHLCKLLFKDEPLYLAYRSGMSQE